MSIWIVSWTCYCNFAFFMSWTRKQMLHVQTGNVRGLECSSLPGTMKNTTFLHALVSNLHDKCNCCKFMLFHHIIVTGSVTGNLTPRSWKRVLKMFPHPKWLKWFSGCSDFQNVVLTFSTTVLASGLAVSAGIWVSEMQKVIKKRFTNFLQINLWTEDWDLS